MTNLFNKKRTHAYVIGFLIFSPQLAFTHGEEKPGPHAGHIRMPGAFHTEVVPVEKDKAKIYLLDIHWKNPSLKGKVDARIGEKAASCTAREDHFWCVFPKGSDLSVKGTLTVQAEREGKKGLKVSYELPLQHKEGDIHLNH